MTLLVDPPILLAGGYAIGRRIDNPTVAKAAGLALVGAIFLPSVTQTIQTFVHYTDRPYPSQGSPLWLDAVVSLRRIMLGLSG